jgi:hypothetical protein
VRFTPETETDIRGDMLLKDGIYDFEVGEAENATSKKGNEMIALDLKVFTPEGQVRFVKDWLVASDQPMCRMKIRHFAKTCGLMEQYEAGELDAFAIQGAAGRVKIGSEENAEFGPKNVVADYVKPDAEPPAPLGVPAAQTKAAMAATAERAVVSGFPDEEIPF